MEYRKNIEYEAHCSRYIIHVVNYEILRRNSVGSRFDMGMQLVGNYFFNEKTAGNIKKCFDTIDRFQVARSGTKNLINLKNDKVVAAITGLGDVIVHWVKKGKKYSCDKVLRDFAMGFLSDLTARYVGKLGTKVMNCFQIHQFQLP